MTQAKLTVDFDANAAYLHLRSGAVAKTMEVAPGVLVDLDDMAVVVGIEVLTLDALIPYSELVTKFHVRHEDLRALDSIRPTVTSFVSRQTAPAASADVNATDRVPC